MKGARAWVVSHVEVFLKPRDYAVDEMVTYVASSKEDALRLIRATAVDPGTWWKIEPFPLDDYKVMGGDAELYSREGRRLKSAPVRQGYRAALPRYRKNAASLHARLAQARREGRPRKDVDLLRKALEGTRACLEGHPVT
jgi:hypothetical protein